jgi:hypothetical protein
LGIGTINPTARLDVAGNISATGGISATGSMQAYSFVQPFDHGDPNRRLRHRHPHEAAWNALPVEGEFSCGLIAQDVEQILPELVPQADGIRTVDYDQLLPILIEAAKVQQKAIGELQAANDNLKATNDNPLEDLERRINKLRAGSLK